MSLSKSSKISQQNITAPNSENSSTYDFEDFRLDVAHLMLYKNGRTIALKPKVVETLVALAERRGEVVGKDELMNRLWADSFVEESNLTQNIYLLRKTLGNCADGQPFIEIFSRRGYRLNGEIKTQNNSAELLVATHTKTQTVIEETIENKPRRNWLLVGGAIITGGLLILSGILLTNYRNKQSAAAAPPQEVLIKRLTPDGRIIYTSTRSGNADLWLMNHDGSNQKQLTSNAGSWNGRPQVTPDGRYIVFASSRTNSNQIWRMEIDGGNQIQLTDGGEFPSLTPDGQWIFLQFKC